MKRSETEAFALYSRAAASSVAAACGNVGMCYLNGEGVVRNAEEGVRWLDEAAARL